MLLYALGTAACAGAHQHLDADRVPRRRQPGHRRRVGGGRGDGRRGRPRDAGASRRARCSTRRRRWGCFSPRSSTDRIAGNLFKSSPETSWRFVFLCGLIPAGVAFVVRMFIKEPERWQAVREGQRAPAPARAVLAGTPPRDPQRLRDGGHRAHHVVDRQRVHPDRVGRAREHRGQAARARSGGDAGRWASSGRRSRRTCSTSAA